MVFSVGHILNSSSFYSDVFLIVINQLISLRLRKLIQYFFFLLGMQGIIKELLGCLKILTPNTPNQFSAGPRGAEMSLMGTAFAWLPSLQSPARAVSTDTNSGLHMLGTAPHGKKSNRRHRNQLCPQNSSSLHVLVPWSNQILDTYRTPRFKGSV